MITLMKTMAIMHEGKPVNSCDLKTYKPEWVPMDVWRKAWEMVEIGCIDSLFKAADGERWRLRVN